MFCTHGCTQGTNEREEIEAMSHNIAWSDPTSRLLCYIDRHDLEILNSSISIKPKDVGTVLLIGPKIGT